MLTAPILALALAAFGIGTTEFVIMGLLPDVARAFGVGIPQAGYLVSGYAMGVVIGAPVVAVATARLPRKTALLGLMTIFLLGNVGCALAPTYALLLCARVLTAFAHGTFFGIGAVVASDLVPRAQRSQAVAIMFTGLTFANVLGVPLGTALGQTAGWRATFWAVAAIGVVALIAIAAFVPSGLPGTRGGILREFRAIGRWLILRPMLISALASVSLFCVFTFITPLLEQVTGLSPHGVAGALLVMGLGLTAGNLLGGRLGDRALHATIRGAFAGTVAILCALALTARWPIPSFVVLALWGGCAFALVSPLQVWVVEAARDAPNLASTLNQAAFNLGNAVGAWIGATALTAGLGYAGLPLIGAAVAAVGLGLTMAGARPAALTIAATGQP